MAFIANVGEDQDMYIGSIDSGCPLVSLLTGAFNVAQCDLSWFYDLGVCTLSKDIILLVLWSAIFQFFSFLQLL